jgi:hypothetical protein
MLRVKPSSPPGVSHGSPVSIRTRSARSVDLLDVKDLEDGLFPFGCLVGMEHLLAEADR